MEFHYEKEPTVNPLQDDLLIFYQKFAYLQQKLFSYFRIQKKNNINFN